MTLYFSPIQNWEIPAAAWSAAYEEMSHYGHRGVEGIAMWLGTRENGVARISHIALLRGTGIRRKRYLIEIDPSIVGELTDAACERNIVLVGQIHSHAPECRTDLSPADRQYGFSVPYFLSIVAPDFARADDVGVADCGVHVFEPRRGYRRLPATEVQQRVVMTNDGIVERITIGGPHDYSPSL